MIDEHLPTGTPVPFDVSKLGKQPHVATVELDPEKEQATFHFATPLPAGPATLEIAYTGILNNKLRGFYLSKTKTRNYGVTQFEATDARRAFPCFDEPALKATFDVSLVIDTGDTAISNTKMVSDTAGAGARASIRWRLRRRRRCRRTWWRGWWGTFSVRKGKSEGVPIRACATPDKVELTKFALDAAKWDLKYYDKYFGIKYPLAKLDLVAIPDFEAGAMENFGCITFRETEMLVDKKDGSAGRRRRRWRRRWRTRWRTSGSATW